MANRNGKVALVTGANKGLGKEIARQLGALGYTVVLTSRDEAAGRAAAAELVDAGSDAHSIQLDVTSADDIARVAREIDDRFGKLDVLVNNAGVFPVTAQTEDHPIEAFAQLMRNNIQTTFLMTKLALPHLQKTKGCVLCAGSESGINGLMQATVYGGTKGWVHAFTQGVAVEQAKHGVRANCVCPGPIDTSWTHARTGPMNKKLEVLTIWSTPLGRRGTPEEVANVYAFLASDEASYVTGALWLVDGGITAAKGPVGIEASGDVKRPPEGELDLEHSREGHDHKPAEHIS